MIKPTIIDENVFKQEDLEFVGDHIRQHGKKVPRIQEWEGPDKGKLLAEMYMWNWNEEPVVQERLLTGLNPDIIGPAIVEWSFVLDSYFPYEIHSDIGWMKINEGEEPWYLAIIPITPNASKTICFEQYEQKDMNKDSIETSHFVHYKERNEPLKEYIDDAYFKENLSHCWDHDQPYLTLEKEFAWNQGSVMYCDMNRYHSSNDYRSNGIDKKTCITLMMKKQIA